MRSAKILQENRKILLNMKVTVIQLVIGALGTIAKRLLQRLEDLEIRGQVEANQTIALLGIARIPSLGVEETCCHSNSCTKKALTKAERLLKD